jgi:hypothetical protein
MISGFGCEVDENCTLLDYYAVSSGNFLPTFNLSVISSGFKQSHLQGSRFLKPEDATNRLSRNVGKKLPLLAV